MRRTILGSAAGLMVAFMAQSASAADIPAPVYKAPPPAAYSWTGFYLGGGLGWLGTRNIGGPFVIPAAPGNSFIAPGVSGGAGTLFAGAQYQFSSIVLGVEAALTRRFNNDFSSTPGIGNAPPVGCNAATTFACEGRLNDIRQVGGRVGWAFNQFMIYGGGGYASAQIDTQARTIATGVVTSVSGARHNGWYAGGGVDVAIPSVRFLVVGIDYRHFSFNTALHDDPATPGNARNVSTTADQVMARVSVKFP